MTQHDLARAVRVPQSTIARIERSSVIPRMVTLTALLEATGHQLVVEETGPPVPLEDIREKLAMSVPKRTRTALGRRVAANPQTSPIWIVRRLRRFAVPFVLIGDLAEAAYGVPVKVKKLIEVCHTETDVARERLGMALEDLGATSSDGFQFETRAGTLRLTTETVAGDNYEVLARTAVRMHVDAGVLVPVASLEDLVRVRLARCAPGDRQAVAMLRAIEREQFRILAP